MLEWGNISKNILAKEGISVGILSCYINMIHPDLSVRETVLRQFERYLQYARKLRGDDGRNRDGERE